MENGFAGLMAAMGSVGESKFKPISVADLDKGFSFIDGLKPGDKVRAKSEGYNIDKTTMGGAVIVVHRVGDWSVIERGKPTEQRDFTALFDDGTNDASIIELAFDSRRFERVTE